MRITLISSSAPFMKLLKRGLEEESHEVRAISSLTDAATAGANVDADMVIIDRESTRADALKAVEWWRANGLSSPIVVLVLPDPPFTRPGFAIYPKFSIYPNVEFLVKPFDFDALLAALERVRASRKTP